MPRRLPIRSFDGQYFTSETSNVSIPGFDLPPWSGTSGAIFNDAIWRSAGDCGFIVGGCSSGSSTRGYRSPSTRPAP